MRKNKSKEHFIDLQQDDPCSFIGVPSDWKYTPTSPDPTPECENRAYISTDKLEQLIQKAAQDKETVYKYRNINIRVPMSREHWISTGRTKYSIEPTYIECDTNIPQEIQKAVDAVEKAVPAIEAKYKNIIQELQGEIKALQKIIEKESKRPYLRRLFS